MDILTLGLLVNDIVVRPVTEQVFSRDSTGAEILFSPGGDACNVASDAARLGKKSGICAAVGNDSAGRAIRESLVEAGVDVRGLRTCEDWPTATSIVLTRPDGERHFVTSTEIFAAVSAEQVTKELLDGAKFLSLNSYYRLAALNDGGVIPAFQLAHELGVQTAMDTAWNRRGAWRERIAPVLYHTDVFIPSLQEAVQITGMRDMRAMREQMEPFGMRVFGVKLGDQGSYVTDFKREYFIKPFPTEPFISTVGAGDAYFAGMLCALAEGRDFYESALFAAGTAVFAIGTANASDGIPDAATVWNFVQEYR